MQKLKPMNEKELSLDRMPPQNIEAEMALLGSMLIDAQAVVLGIEKVEPEYFYKDNHRKIFQMITQLFNRNQAVDVVTVADALKKANLLEEIGGPAYLASLASLVPTAANVGYYARIIKEKYILRSLIHVSTQIINECYEPITDADDLLDRAEASIFEIATHKIEGSFVSIKEIIKSSIETIDNLYQRKANVTGLPTGFTEFDVLTAGLQPSDFIVVAGRPSMGKSAFVASIAEHVGIVEKKPVVIFSLEMSKEQLVQRMLCSHARVDAHRVRTGLLSQSDWPRLTNAAGKLSEAPIFIDDTPAISVLELRAKARRLKSTQDIQLLILDYLQLMKGPANVENRQQEIAEISRSLKALARELNIPLVAVSQLSRAVEARADHRPQLSDLRESGAIEQDADVVVLLLREEYYNPTEENRGLAEVNIAKQRNGPTDIIKLAFIKEYARFENLSREEI
ncbi:MAG: replicative DNA helicase [Candidatus Omnitrophica bacterium]|nr:replicative DNA helicase [Candidatus Omnitrophota bacterium]MCM8793111.1 replicative DNA helicase [Candidatus Omnitrophota bacterium]